MQYLYVKIPHFFFKSFLTEPPNQGLIDSLITFEEESVDILDNAAML